MSKSNTQNSSTQIAKLNNKVLGLHSIADKIKIGAVGTLNAGFIAELRRIDCEVFGDDLAKEVNHVIYSRINEEIDKINEQLLELENGNN